MPCLGPRLGYPGKEVNPLTGKRRLVFNIRDAFSPVGRLTPCGQCIQCRLSYARDWSVRLDKENKCHESSSFITLTYDDEHLPDGGSLVKDDIALFHKRLHNRLLRSRGYGIRFYYSGEYGDTFKRPHYHSIIFGFDFPDKKFYKRNERDEPIFVSEFLSDLWPAGRNGIGMVSFDSCMYVAGYVTKKLSTPHDSESERRFAAEYGRLDADGRFYLVEPVFSEMSRRPGIGSAWLAKFGSETYRDDKLVVNGALVRPPRYFDNLYLDVDPARMEQVKKVRRVRGIKFNKQFTSRRSYAMERITKAKLGVRKKDV